MKHTENPKGNYPLLQKLTAEQKIALNQISNDTEIFYVRDTYMAGALAGAGFLLRLDPPYTYKIQGGKPIITWNFEAVSNEGIHFKEFIKHWKNWETFCAQNPNHPHAGAISAVKHSILFVDWIKGDTPYVPFKSQCGKKTVWVKHNSKKYRNCIASGLERL